MWTAGPRRSAHSQRDSSAQGATHWAAGRQGGLWGQIHSGRDLRYDTQISLFKDFPWDQKSCAYVSQIKDTIYYTTSEFGIKWSCPIEKKKSDHYRMSDAGLLKLSLATWCVSSPWSTLMWVAYWLTSQVTLTGTHTNVQSGQIYDIHTCKSTNISQSSLYYAYTCMFLNHAWSISHAVQ